MSGGPFRELFVEVPLAILEAAVREKLEPPSKPETPAAKPETPAAKLGLVHPDVWIVLFSDYPPEARDWTLDFWERDVARERIVVKVRLRCGHGAYFAVDERKLASCALSKRDLAAYILSVADKEPKRRCTCGTPQGLGPAGRAP